MKAILIDPTNNSVTEIDYSGNYKDIYGIIGGNEFSCRDITTKDGQVNSIYIDESINLDEVDYGFQYENEYPCIGKGLVLGLDVENGETIGTNLTVEEVRKNVRTINSMMGLKMAFIAWEKNNL